MPFRQFSRLVRFIVPLVLLVACRPNQAANTAQLSVVVSTQILGDVVRQIGGEYVDIVVIIPPDTDPHAYEPVPRDAARIAEADLIFVNGLGLEEALQSLLDANASRVVMASDGVAAIEATEEEHSEEGQTHSEDPHIWMNPQNVKVWADNIAAALATADSAHADTYIAAAEAYKAELDELDEWAMQQIAQIPADQRILVTDHESFGYFAEHYDFQIIGAIVPSSSTLGETSAGDLATLEDTIRQYHVKAIFVGVSMNPAIADQLAADTGVEVVAIYTESLTEAGGDAPTYLNMLRFDVEAIVAALR